MFFLEKDLALHGIVDRQTPAPVGMEHVRIQNKRVRWILSINQRIHPRFFASASNLSAEHVHQQRVWVSPVWKGRKCTEIWVERLRKMKDWEWFSDLVCSNCLVWSCRANAAPLMQIDGVIKLLLEMSRMTSIEREKRLISWCSKPMVWLLVHQQCWNCETGLRTSRRSEGRWSGWSGWT